MRPSICVGIIMHRKELLRRCFPGCAGNRKPPAPSCTKKRFWTSCRPEKRNISPESPYFLRIHRRSRSLAARQQSSRLHMYRKNPEILHSLTADSSSPGFYFPLSKTSVTFFQIFRDRELLGTVAFTAFASDALCCPAMLQSKPVIGRPDLPVIPGTGSILVI